MLVGNKVFFSSQPTCHSYSFSSLRLPSVFARLVRKRSGFSLLYSPFALSFSSSIYLSLKNLHSSFMAMDKGRPLPKFGEWDVNNPASAEGFTVIFNKARDEKKTNNNPATVVAAPQRHDMGGYDHEDPYRYQRKSKWFCCG